MFGYSTKNNDFIIEHHAIILAMLVPFAVEAENCFDLAMEICTIIQEDTATMLKNAFLPIYLHLHLNTNEGILTKGIEFVMKQTNDTVYRLLTLDHEVSKFELIFGTIDKIIPIEIFVISFFFN